MRARGVSLHGQSRLAARLGPRPDYVEMRWLMLQQKQPEDFVIATGRQESVRRFIELSAQQLGWGL